MKERETSVVLSYSEAFKQQIVNLVESGESTVIEVMRQYDIRGKMTVYKWLKQYGRNTSIRKVVHVQTPDEKTRIQLLEEENRMLKEALANTQIQKICTEVHLEVALEYLDEDQKKSVLSKLSPAQRRQLSPMGTKRP